MVTTVPKPIRLLARGQLTLPKEVREALKLEENSQLNTFAIGRCIILTPKSLMRSAFAKNVQKAMKSQKLGLKDLLADLKKERQRYNREHYGF